LRPDDGASGNYGETGDMGNRGQTERFLEMIRPLFPLSIFMARLSRVVAVDTPHHITQRGNARQYVLETDADRPVYLDLLRRNCRLEHLSLLGYCLMSNHVHLIAVPERDDSLRLALKHTHGRYAAYFNARCASSGHVWQGRYYSCPLDPPHLWAALRYTELNPVRAGIVAAPAAYPWSSAAAHRDDCADDALDMQPWRREWTPAAWRAYLDAAVAPLEADAIRRSTHTGRPLGGPDFVTRISSPPWRRP
jgi:putative transposase